MLYFFQPDQIYVKDLRVINDNKLIVHVVKLCSPDPTKQIFLVASGGQLTQVSNTITLFCDQNQSVLGFLLTQKNSWEYFFLNIAKLKFC